MSPFERRRTGSDASDGATWLGGPPPNQARRRSASKPHKANVGRPRKIRVEVHPVATFGEATKSALSDLLQDELVRYTLKWAMCILALAAYMKCNTPGGIEPCPAPSPSKVNTAMSTEFVSSALQPTSVESQARPNTISAVEGYGNKAAGYGVKVAEYGRGALEKSLKHGMENSVIHGAGIALAAAPGLWSNSWPGSNSGQHEHKYDPHRTRAWDLVIQKGKNMTTFTSLLSDLEGLSGTLYREFAEQMVKISPGISPGPQLLGIVGQLHDQHSDITGKLNHYQKLRKRAADALYIHRHPESDEQQLDASVKDLNTMRTALEEVGSGLFANFHVAEKQIDGIIKAAESLPWQKEKDTWLGAYKHRSMIAAVGRLRQFDACIKTVRGMITSDLSVLG